MRKIKIWETRKILRQIKESGVSGQGDVALIKEVGELGKTINHLQRVYKTADSGILTKVFNESYRIEETLFSSKVVEVVEKLPQNPIYVVTGKDGIEWEVKLLGNGPECEVRPKGETKWQDAIWGIFCKNHGVDYDAIAQQRSIKMKKSKMKKSKARKILEELNPNQILKNRKEENFYIEKSLNGYTIWRNGNITNAKNPSIEFAEVVVKHHDSRNWVVVESPFVG